jgi:hypothetical protein
MNLSYNRVILNITQSVGSLEKGEAFHVKIGMNSNSAKIALIDSGFSYIDTVSYDGTCCYMTFLDVKHPPGFVTLHITKKNVKTIYWSYSN